MQIHYDNSTVSYKYVKDRDYSFLNNDFLINTLTALDFLYENDIMTLTYNKNKKNEKTLDIIDVLIDESKELIHIVQGESNKYFPASNTIHFKDTHGVTFRKNYKKRFSGSNIGYNSPVALLAHELIHCYHELFDENGYKSRRIDRTTKGKKINQRGADLSFPNHEEKLVISLTNQVAKRLGEDKRGNYGRNYYATESVISITKKRNYFV